MTGLYLSNMICDEGNYQENVICHNFEGVATVKRLVHVSGGVKIESNQTKVRGIKTQRNLVRLLGITARINLIENRKKIDKKSKLL